jgi:hypothetical protein
MTSDGETQINSGPGAKKPKVDAEGFFTVPPRRTSLRKLQKQQVNATLTQNAFDDLSGNETDMSIDDINQRKKRSHSSPGMTAAPPDQNPIKKPQNPRTNSEKPSKPIVVVNTTFQTLQTLLSTLQLKKNPLIHKRRGSDFTITAYSTADKKLIVEKLKSQKTNHFTFTEVEDRRMMFILLGHHEITADELQEKLKSNNIPAVKVHHINASTIDPVFLVAFEKGSVTLDELQHQHTIIEGLRIRWDKHLSQNRRPSQCHRCQRHGHAASNCTMPFRCVKCTLTHDPGQCARASRTEGQPSCVNCGKVGHTSNSINCAAYIKHVASINAKKKPSSQQQQRHFSSSRYDWNERQHSHHITEDFNINHNNFPEIASQSFQPSTSRPQYVNINREYRPLLSQAQKVPQAQNKPNDPFSQLRELQNEFASLPDIEETLKLFADFVEEMKSAKDQGDRISILIKHTGNKSQFSSSQK